MSIYIISKPGWLAATIGNKRSRIAALFAEIAGLGAPSAMKPRVFKKFLALLAQISSEEEKERDILVHIEAVELKHRMARANNQLEKADPDYLAGKEPKSLWHIIRVFLHADNKDICH